MLPKLRISLIGIFVAVAVVSGCSRASVPDQAGEQASRTGSGDKSLSLQGPQSSVSPGGQAYVQGSGGVPPYAYYIISGNGSIGADTGLFTADLGQGTVKIGVRDSAGTIATTTLSVGAGWGSSLVLSPPSGTITVTQKLTLSASGGSAPYYFAVLSGPGSVSGSVYTAPASTGSVTLIVVDSVGGTATATYMIQAVQPLVLSPTTQTMVAGTQYTFAATGGVPPYTWSIPFGGGAVSKGKYTASLIAGPARVQVTDAQGSIAYADITITPNYSTSHQSATFSLIVDHYLAFSYDNSDATDQEHPSFTFWGSGPNADATDPGKNCSPFTGKCAYVVTLNGFSNSNFAYATYRGTIGMSGRGGGAQISFCIDPADITRAKVRWEQGTGFTKQVQYNLTGKTLFNGAPTISAFTLIDSQPGAGIATINFDGAYTGDIDCSDFAGASAVVVNPR